MAPAPGPPRDRRRRPAAHAGDPVRRTPPWRPWARVLLALALAVAAWVPTRISIALSNKRVPAGDVIELKVEVGSGSRRTMWFAYDTLAYDSGLSLP